MIPAFGIPVANLIGMPAPSPDLVFPLSTELLALLPLGFAAGLAIVLATAKRSQRLSRRTKRPATVVPVGSAA